MCDPKLLNLVSQKLSITGERLIEYDNEILELLQLRVESELNPTLKSNDQSGFQLNKVIELLEELKRSIGAVSRK